MNMSVQNRVHGKQNVGVGVKNTELWECVWTQMTIYLFRTSRYRSAFINSMGNTNQKPTRYTQKLKRKKHKHNPKKIIKPQGKRLKEQQKNREELQNQSETNNKMAISTYLSIISLNIKGVKYFIKRYAVADWIYETYLNAAYNRLISNLQTYTDWKWGVGKRYPM